MPVIAYTTGALLPKTFLKHLYDAVGKAFVFANVAHQPRAEIAAKEGVHHAKRRVCCIASVDGFCSHPDG